MKKQVEPKKQNNTQATKPKVAMIGNDWFLFDAKEQILGRLATQLATKLQGKDKASWEPQVDPKVNVIVINANKVAITGTKEKNKEYFRYSGYPGGLKRTTAGKLRAQNPEEIIHHAVKGMLPKNKLSRRIIARLLIYKNDEHPHTAQKPIPVTSVR